MRGAAFVVAGGVLALLISAYGLERLKFSPGYIIAFRVAMIMIAGALAANFFVLPQWRPITAELMVRKAVTQPFEHVPMVFNQDTKSFDGMLFDLPGSIDYFVESGGVKSSVFTMHAAELPYVKKLEMEYVFPAYTGIAPRRIENGGDIAVLQGTHVRMRITPTMKAPSGRILVDGNPVALTPDGAGFIGEITVNKDGCY